MIGKHFTETSNKVELRINHVRINRVRPVFMYIFFLILVTCDVLDIPNGAAGYSNSSVSGKLTAGTNNTGYRKVGPDSRNCNTSGNWTGQTQTCTQGN